MNKALMISILALLMTFPAFAQIGIEDCQQKARENYPLIKRYALIEKSEQYSVSNAQKGYLPQFQVNAKATYQSAVTAIPIELPGIDIPKLRKDQYLAAAEVNQTLWDGGIIRSQTQIAKANAEVERQQLEVELYTIEDRVNQLFFGILLIDAQLEQNRILSDELERSRKKVVSLIENGLANDADLDAVKVEQLNVEQAKIQLKSVREAYIEMLSLMTGEKMTSETVFQKPQEPVYEPVSEYGRSELRLFDAREQLLESQKDLVKSGYMPRLGLFLQGGYGRPALNMLSNAFEAFYIGGLRLTWNFGSLYTAKNDLRKIDLNRQTVDAQRDLFLYNIRLAESRENKDIQRIKAQMKNDAEIIALRENIRKSAEAKVANGALTVTDLLQEISREDLARQTAAAHEIDLLMAIYKLKNTRGK